MEHVKRQIFESGLPPERAQALVQLLETNDASAISMELGQLALAGHGEVVVAVCNYLIDNNTTDPEVYNLMGYVFHARQDPLKAGFYFLSAFMMGRYLPAATNLLRVFRETNHYIPGLLFSRSLGAEPTDTALTELQAHFEDFATGGDPTEDQRSTFIVSHLHSSKTPRTRKAFIAEPFLRHLLERDGTTKKFDAVETATAVRTHKDDLKNCIQFVTERNERYLAILSERLNTLHNLRASPRFWRKTFAIALIRHITLLYDFFKICETHFDPLKHTCEVLTAEGYHTPLDYDEQRWFLQHQHYGQEQLLSLYMRTFFPGNAPEFNGRYQYEYKISPVGVFHNTQPRVGIMCAFFAPRYLDDLVRRSSGEVNSIGFDRNFQIYDRQFNPEARKFLAQLPPNADRFDRFFFETLPELMPRVFVEYFLPVAVSIEQQVARYSRLQFAVSEMWLSETYESMGLALLGEMGVKHIYNEHNYNEYPYYANQLHLQASVPDVYLAHGRYSAPIDNLVQAGSLFEFAPANIPQHKSTKIMYVSSIGLAKYSNYSHIYMETAEHVDDYYKFKLKFFEAISPEVRSTMLYRGYPKDEYARMWDLHWDDGFMMRDHLHGIRLDDHKKSCKALLAEAELVIVDYISTTYLEALSMNVPMIFFVRWSSAFLNQENANFFSELIEAGICHDDPVRAARFIEHIRLAPLKWWTTDKVQAARARFLEKNLGTPEDAMQYYLGLLSTPARPS
jgi:hypothetical protein